MFKGFATIVTNVVPTVIWPNAATPATLAQLTPVFGTGAGSLRVWGGVVSNLTGSNIHVSAATYPGAITLWGALIGPNQTVVVPIPFITNAGLSVTCTVADAASFTFFHSQIT